MEMSWHEYINSDPKILKGKPVINGTSIPVDLIIGLRASGWSEEDILKNYPVLSEKSLQAIYAFALECINTVLGE